MLGYLASFFYAIFGTCTGSCTWVRWLYWPSITLFGGLASDNWQMMIAAHMLNMPLYYAAGYAVARLLLGKQVTVSADAAPPPLDETSSSEGPVQ